MTVSVGCNSADRAEDGNSFMNMQVLDEKLALEGWVRGSVAEQTETCTRLKSIQVLIPCRAHAHQPSVTAEVLCVLAEEKQRSGLLRSVPFRLETSSALFPAEDLAQQQNYFARVVRCMHCHYTARQPPCFWRLVCHDICRSLSLKRLFPPFPARRWTENYACFAQAQSQEQREELVTHNALLAALLVQLAQRDAELADLRSATSARQPSLARKPSQKLLRALSVPGARAKPPSPKQDTLLTPAQPPMTSARSMTSAVTSPRAAEPCTPSKGPPLPPHAAERRAACNSAAAVTDPAESPEQTLAAGSAGARKRLCMGEGVNSQGNGVGMEEAGEAVRDAEASGQLSSAVSIEAGAGKLHGSNEASELDDLLEDRERLNPERADSADAEQVSPEQLPPSWKLLAAEKPLSICADCAMPPTPEKHAIVQVIAGSSTFASSCILTFITYVLFAISVARFRPWLSDW